MVLLRNRVTELMDDPSLDEVKHIAALRDLERLNSLSRSASLLFHPLKSLAKSDGSVLRVLDLATGGGDTPIDLSRRAKVCGLEMQIDGCDFSQRAVAYATSKAQQHASSCKFFCLDVFAQDLPSGYDVIMCSLFTHHMDAKEVILLLKKMSGAARQALFVNDLLRSAMNLFLVTVATRLVSNSAVVQFDGPASVRAAYTLQEMRDMAQSAGLTDFQLSEHFPCRLLLEWKRK
jgi:2-polyprenyl-3-methyl-5-hydroxy-6-metoxy-1,4-benzoquinol methylase